jgi:hypothetical protein
VGEADVLDPLGCARRLASNALAFRALLDGVEGAQARWKPEPGKWSLLEVVNHLADEEREDFRVRLELLLRDPSTPWSPIDPEGWASERGYNERALDASLERFLRERAASVEWLGSLAKVSRDGVHQRPGRVPLTASDLLVSWLAHDLIHLRQIVRLHYQYLTLQAGHDSPGYAGPW